MCSSKPLRKFCRDSDEVMIVNMFDQSCEPNDQYKRDLGLVKDLFGDKYFDLPFIHKQAANDVGRFDMLHLREVDDWARYD